VRADEWIDPGAESILDVGCNVGAWLSDLRLRWPTARLAGVEPSPDMLAIAKRRLPGLELHVAGAESLPFADRSFSVVTCIEVLEHVPAELRRQAFREIHRVLVPGGRLILTVPHAGWFAFLDSNNIRFRLPKLYGLAIGRGLRDGHGPEIEWHHHFRIEELYDLMGDGFRVLNVRYGSLFVAPLADWLSWPFYRAKRPDHWARKALERAAEWDARHDYGQASYRVMLVLERDDSSRRAGPTPAAR
jgi:SAM-dependent methyltransferase